MRFRDQGVDIHEYRAGFSGVFKIYLFARFGANLFDLQATPDNIPTLWLERGRLLEVLAHLKTRFPMLLDLFGIDERLRQHKPAAALDFTVGTNFDPLIS